MTISLYEYGSVAEGLHFTIQYDSRNNSFTIHSLYGELDVNALWFAGEKGSANTVKTLKADGQDINLNMNGSTNIYASGTLAEVAKLSWDTYLATESKVGLGDNDLNASNDAYLLAGESYTINADPFDGADFSYIGVRATSTSTAEGGIKWAATASETTNSASGFVDPNADEVGDRSAPGVAAVGDSYGATEYMYVGTGIIANDFTMSETGNLQLGLQAHVRHNAQGFPSNETYSNGDGSYGSLDPVTGMGYNLNDAVPGRAVWNFDMSVNTQNGGGTNNLDSFYYELALDTDPTSGKSFTTVFDPFSPQVGMSFAGHKILSSSGEVQAYVPGNDAAYSAAFAAGSTIQQSWNLGFFMSDALFQAEGTYTVRLSAFRDTNSNYISGAPGELSELVDYVEIDILQAGYSLI